MKARTRAVAYGAAGLALASLVVFSGSALGFLPVSPSGVVSIMLTDPPTVPDGVSGVYITYSGVAVHAVGFSNSSGWVGLAGHGTIESLGLINLSQTISSGTIPRLTYNLVRFDITGVMVDYNGKNYTATIDSGRLEVPIVGGLKVNSSGTSAALVDIQPTIVNLGGQADPTFAMATGARALQVPSGDLDEQSAQIGHRTSLSNHDWFQSFNSNLVVSGVNLSPTSFSFTATNGGTQPVTVRLVSLTQASPGEKPTSALGSITNSIIFLVDPNGTLELLSGPPGQVMAAVTSAGCMIGAKTTQGFSYSGQVTTLLSKAGISSGGSYYIVVFGSEATIAQTVVAA